MPIMDGIEATREIIEYEQSENLKHTPIIALTANALKGDKERFLEAGMNDYLSKPIEVKEVENVLKHYCNHMATKDIPEEEEVLIVSDEHFNIEKGCKGLHVSYSILISLVKEYLANINIDKNELIQSFEKQDFEKAKSMIHKLKGSSANLRLNILAALCKEAEQEIKKDNIPLDIIQKIEDEISLLHKRMR